ncbi:exopolygalacturonase-like [Cucurbita pepo subsp. pepo]|uniref:exopolygalacturonase-like n=1 Tax=Cucurbita pepo subsp. pepo TaxID=3664 RepID=UPI000C9D39FB|nr:exopolygalacturonase-like [Cucurbita pepo subsp. pepo]
MSLISSETGSVVFITILLCLYQSYAQSKVFDITQYGATPDESIDSTKGLSMAWRDACANKGGGVVLVPSIGRFLVLPVLLQGPCNGLIQLQINGDLLASSDKAFATGYSWFKFYRVTNLVIQGLGRFLGQVIAPEDSPNTDGIHISKSTGVTIMNSIISTGDDCISFGPGSKDVNITNVHCGPGHGISIGSLGKYQNEPNIDGITVRDSQFVGTKNGVQIKTWSKSYPSVVSNLTFVNLKMYNVESPIMIDQNYCPHNACHNNKVSVSRIQIKDVKYENIRGTSAKQLAVTLNCSQVVPCQGIALNNINLVFNGSGSSTSVCQNIQGSASGPQLPPSCL